MNTLARTGGVAALIMALSYLVGIAVFALALNPETSLNLTEQVEYLVANQSLIYLTMLFIYVIAGFALLLLVQSLHERLKPNNETLMQTTTVVGFIWSGVVIAAGMIYLVGMDSVIELSQTEMVQAASLWQSIIVVFQGLGGGTEIIGGVWMLLISYVALKSHLLPKFLNILGFIVGIAGVVTIIPVLKDATMLFGLGQIPWFIGVGIALIRQRKN